MGREVSGVEASLNPHEMENITGYASLAEGWGRVWGRGGDENLGMGGGGMGDGGWGRGEGGLAAHGASPVSCPLFRRGGLGAGREKGREGGLREGAVHPRRST